MNQETKEKLYAILMQRSATDSDTGCRIWLGGKASHSHPEKCYGEIRVSEPGKTTRWRVHRLMWEINHGDIPANLLVRHFCHTRLCINIDHLGIGTAKDNYEDARKAGRHTHGEIQGSAKMTADQVKEIRRLRDESVSQRKVAKMFGIGRTTVAHIERRESWSHVT